MTTATTNPPALGAMLAEYRQHIAALDTALVDAGTARSAIVAAQADIDHVEATLALTIEGRNETERRARLTLALETDAGHQEATARHRAA